MIRTDWLNTSVDCLRSSLRHCTDEDLFRMRNDILDTLVEAERIGHRTRHTLLFHSLRDHYRCRSCNQSFIARSRPKKCPLCGLHVEGRDRGRAA